MSYDDNPVYLPARYGFEKVGEIDLENEPWQYYILAVLKNEKGYYLTTDSGCSCPSPFESHTVDDLTGPLTAAQAREEIQSLVDIASESGFYEGPEDPTELLALIND